MFKQVLRSGTSVGANVSEAEYAISESDLLSKLYIALKECAETLYWVELLRDTGYITSKEFKSIYDDAEEIRKILSSSTKTLKTKLETKQKKK